MIWVAWRQSRAAAYGMLAVTAGFTLLTVLEQNGRMVGASRSMSIYLTLFVGVLLGAPLLAQEFEHGTHRMIWTQGITRARWLAGRCVVALGLALVATGAVHTVIIAVAENGRRTFSAPPLDGLGVSGPVLYARAIWMVLLGLLVGALVRRTTGAIALTAGGWMATQLLLDSGVPTWLPSSWRDDFWAVQLATTGLLLGLSAVALAGTVLALGLGPAVRRRRTRLAPVRG